MKKVACLLLVLSLLVTIALPSVASVDSENEFYFEGQDAYTEESFSVGEEPLKAKLTGISFGDDAVGKYGSNRIINIVEADLSDVNLGFDVINLFDDSESAGCINSQGYLLNGVTEYQKENEVILAAVCGEWMSAADSQNLNISDVSYKVTCGVQMIDGELWCSEITSQELFVDGPYSFGVTSDNQPVIGILKAQISLTNMSTQQSIILDGLNRAPANNAIYAYNYRLNSQNGAKSDAYEIVIESEDSRFMKGKAVEGTVCAIYESGSAERPVITEGQVVVSARGGRLSELASGFAIGDTVKFETSLHDPWSYNNSLWQDVSDVISGRTLLIKDGITYDPCNLSYDGEEPVSFIGIKDDGEVMMVTVTADANGTRAGIKATEFDDFCRDIGYNTCFVLGKGSNTAMVALDSNGTYANRSFSAKAGEGEKLNCALALVYDESGCTGQGNLDYIKSVQTAPGGKGNGVVMYHQYYWGYAEVGNKTGIYADPDSDSVCTLLTVSDERGNVLPDIQVSKKADGSYSELFFVVPENLFKVYAEFDLKGDVNGDGEITTVDSAMANSYVKKKGELSEASLLCADVNGDGEVTTVDPARINGHARGNSRFWWSK